MNSALYCVSTSQCKKKILYLQCICSDSSRARKPRDFSHKKVCRVNAKRTKTKRENGGGGGGGGCSSVSGVSLSLSFKTPL